MVSIPNANSANSSNYLSFAHLSANNNNSNNSLTSTTASLNNYPQSLLQIRPLQNALPVSYSISSQTVPLSSSNESNSNELIYPNEYKNSFGISTSSSLTDGSSNLVDQNFNSCYGTSQNEFFNKYYNSNSLYSAQNNLLTNGGPYSVNTNRFPHANNYHKPIQNSNFLNTIYQNNYFGVKDYQSGFSLSNFYNHPTNFQHQYKPYESTQNDLNFQYQTNQYEPVSGNNVNLIQTENSFSNNLSKMQNSGSAFETVTSNSNCNLNNSLYNMNRFDNDEKDYENNSLNSNIEDSSSSLDTSKDESFLEPLNFPNFDKTGNVYNDAGKKSNITAKIGSQSSNQKKTRTKDKYRVVYNELQRTELEKEFNFSKYITSRRKSELALILDLSQRQIKIWFQNRRAKDRKIIKKKKKEMGSINNESYKPMLYSSETNSMSQVNSINNYEAKPDYFSWKNEQDLSAKNKSLLMIDQSAQQELLNINTINSKTSIQDTQEMYQIFVPSGAGFNI